MLWEGEEVIVGFLEECIVWIVCLYFTQRQLGRQECTAEPRSSTSKFGGHCERDVSACDLHTDHVFRLPLGTILLEIAEMSSLYMLQKRSLKLGRCRLLGSIVLS